MYETFFQLSRRPFAAAPQLDLYFRAEHIEQARQSVIRAVDREEGPSLIIGPAGTGKTLLCQLVADELIDRFQVVTLASGRLCTRRALLQCILFELKLDYRQMDEGELRLTLADHLEPRNEYDRGLLLIVDEAHTLPYRLLEEIRILSNHVHQGRPRVSLVLAGNAGLEEHFAHPKLASFQQRIAQRCYLQSFNREETKAYVHHHLACASHAGEIFIDGALDAIYTATDGIPRLINQLCDHALLLASLGGNPTIDRRGVEEAWADLQQLPVPWNSDEAVPAAGGSNASVIEFGSLDGDDSDDAPSEPDLEAGVESATVELRNDDLSSFDADSDDLPTATIPFMVDPSISRPIPSVTADADEASLESTLIESSSTLEPMDDELEERPIVATFCSQPEVELFFHSPHEAFGEKFEEEEVVIDHYASLDTPGTFVQQTVRCVESEAIRDELDKAVSALPGRGRVDETPVDSQSLADREAALDSLPSPAASIDLEIPATESTEDHRGGDEVNVDSMDHGLSADFQPASDPLIPVPEEVDSQQPEVAAQAVDSPELPAEPEQDDRDLLIIEQAGADSDQENSSGRVRRTNYRQLFAQLRNR